MSSDLKTIGRDLLGNPPLLIALVVGVAAVAFILIRNSNNAATVAVTSAPASTLPQGGGGTYVEESYNNYQVMTTTTTPPPVIVPPVITPPILPPVILHPIPLPQMIAAVTRARGTGDPGYDRSAKGLPWGGPGGLIPYSTAVTTNSRTADANGNVQVSYNGATGSMHIWDLGKIN